MADFATTLSQIMANSRQQQLPDVRRAPVILPWATGNEGYGRIGEAFGKGLGTAVEKGYVEPRLQIAREHALMEGSPAIAMERGKQTWDLLNQMDPQVAAKTIQNPDVQKRLSVYSKYLPEMFPQGQDGQFTFVPRPKTKPEMEQSAIAGLPVGQQQSFFTDPTFAEIASKRAGAEHLTSEAVKNYATTDQLIPAQAGAFRANTALDIAKTGEMPARLALEGRQVGAQELSAQAHMKSAGEGTFSKQIARIEDANNRKSVGIANANALRTKVKDVLGRVVDDPTTLTASMNSIFTTLRSHADTMRTLDPNSLKSTNAESLNTLGQYSRDLEKGINRWVKNPSDPLGIDSDYAAEQLRDALSHAVYIKNALGQPVDTKDPDWDKLLKIQATIDRWKATKVRGGKK